jgi:23S rRNA (cytidine1920-2'-O)/16S rRNA (cytidine1409-2'-O)-methyltransferase
LARETRRLDAAVAEQTGLTRSQARGLILAGRVRVDGARSTKPGTHVAPAAALEVVAPSRFVSRGGEKLDRALHAFGIDATGLRALDVGASTGGFTDCLLAHGAAHVTALDVGYGQLAWKLRIDPRVTVVERTNFRLVPDDAFGEPFDVITIDASFISLRMLLPRAARLLRPAGAIVALVKPQFEAGRERVGGGGVVRDPAVHREVLADLLGTLAPLGLIAAGLVRSALRGPAGNTEFFLLLKRTGTPIGPAAIEAALADGERGGSGG